MTSQVRLAQLYALRAQVEALIAAEETEQMPQDTGCTHPDEKRRDVTTAGGPRRFLCLQCGQEVLGVA